MGLYERRRSGVILRRGMLVVGILLGMSGTAVAAERMVLGEYFTATT